MFEMNNDYGKILRQSKPNRNVLVELRKRKRYLVTVYKDGRRVLQERFRNPNKAENRFNEIFHSYVYEKR